VAFKEFIVYGKSDKEIERKATQIFNEYKKAETRPYYRTDTCGPLTIIPFMRSEQTSIEIDWPSLRQRQKTQKKDRKAQRGGCIFHDSTDAEHPTDIKEFRREMRDVIERSLSIHREPDSAQQFLFAGSLYGTKQFRFGEVFIIEASNLEHAADISDLIFLAKLPAKTLTEWCNPIFGTDENETG
jgi:hypothetical protein